MKNIFRPEELERHLSDFLEIGTLYFQKTQGLNFLKAVVNYVFEATEIEDEKLIEAFTYASEKGKEIAMTTAEKLRYEGRKEGLQEGREEGHKEGRKEGRKEGLQEGLPKGKFSMMVNMIRNARNNGLSEDVIARIVNLDLNSVKKVINNEPIDIPLHLLESRE